MMTTTHNEIMFRFPNEISNQIVAFMGETPSAKLMQEKAKEYNYIYGSCKEQPFVDFIGYVLYYSNSINLWKTEYQYYKQKYNFINQHILTDNYDGGVDYENIYDGAQYEGIFDDSDDEDQEQTHNNDQDEQDMLIMQEEIIETETETDFEDLCPTIYDFYKLNMYCHEFSYTVEYFYKHWVENKEEMEHKLNTYQPMFEHIW